MENLTNPVILFFIFGILAGSMKSNLEVPQQISKFLSLYLLMAIGLKGGHALSESGFNGDVMTVLSIAVGMAFITPVISYFFLKRYLSEINAASVAATFGSISAVTFVTANQFLDGVGVPHDQYMSAAMTLMESPAIIVAVVIANKLKEDVTSKREVVYHSLTEGANMLLLASLVIGIVMGDYGYTAMSPFTGDLFTGLLAFFLLDMGIQVSRNLPALRGKSGVLLGYAVVVPMLHATAALLLCDLLGVSMGNAVLMMVLAASASYIAVPAALKQAIPEADASVYLGLSLGITFPFNVIVGIPLYYAMASTYYG